MTRASIGLPGVFLTFGIIVAHCCVGSRWPNGALVASLRRGPFDMANVDAGSRVVAAGGACSDGARRGAETLSESARKMRVVAKAAGVGDVAERLACLDQRAAFDQTRRMIQTGRTYVVTACRPTDGE
jgi:hypothetical protein